MKKESGGATIKDVARETNLAISTISKYMNGGRVRKKIRSLLMPLSGNCIIFQIIQRDGLEPANLIGSELYQVL